MEANKAVQACQATRKLNPPAWSILEAKAIVGDECIDALIANGYSVIPGKQLVAMMALIENQICANRKSLKLLEALSQADPMDHTQFSAWLHDLRHLLENGKCLVVPLP